MTKQILFFPKRNMKSHIKSANGDLKFIVGTVSYNQVKIKNTNFIGSTHISENNLNKMKKIYEYNKIEYDRKINMYKLNLLKEINVQEEELKWDLKIDKKVKKDVIKDFNTFENHFDKFLEKQKNNNLIIKNELDKKPAEYIFKKIKEEEQKIEIINNMSKKIINLEKKFNVYQPTKIKHGIVAYREFDDIYFSFITSQEASIIFNCLSENIKIKTDIEVNPIIFMNSLIKMKNSLFKEYFTLESIDEINKLFKSDYFKKEILRYGAQAFKKVINQSKELIVVSEELLEKSNNDFKNIMIEIDNIMMTDEKSNVFTPFQKGLIDKKSKNRLNSLLDLIIEGNSVTDEFIKGCEVKNIEEFPSSD